MLRMILLMKPRNCLGNARLDKWHTPHTLFAHAASGRYHTRKIRILRYQLSWRTGLLDSADMGCSTIHYDPCTCLPHSSHNCLLVHRSMSAEQDQGHSVGIEYNFADRAAADVVLMDMPRTLCPNPLTLL